MDKQAEIEVLKEQMIGHDRRITGLENIALTNAQALGRLMTTVALTAQHVETLTRLAYGGVGVVLLGVVIMVLKSAIHGFATQ